jgi:hypothetical protein
MNEQAGLHVQLYMSSYRALAVLQTESVTQRTVRLRQQRTR